MVAFYGGPLPLLTFSDHLQHALRTLQQFYRAPCDTGDRILSDMAKSASLGLSDINLIRLNATVLFVRLHSCPYAYHVHVSQDRCPSGISPCGEIPEGHLSLSCYRNLWYDSIQNSYDDHVPDASAGGGGLVANLIYLRHIFVHQHLAYIVDNKSSYHLLLY